MNLRYRRDSTSTHPMVVVGVLGLVHLDSTVAKICHQYFDTWVEASEGWTMDLLDQSREEPKKFDRGKFLASLKPAVDRLKEDEEAWESLRAEDAILEGAIADGLDE